MNMGTSSTLPSVQDSRLNLLKFLQGLPIFGGEAVPCLLFIFLLLCGLAPYTWWPHLFVKCIFSCSDPNGYQPLHSLDLTSPSSDLVPENLKLGALKSWNLASTCCVSILQPMHKQSVSMQESTQVWGLPHETSCDPHRRRIPWPAFRLWEWSRSAGQVASYVAVGTFWPRSF